MRVYQTAQTLWQSAGSWKGVAKVLFFTELQNGIRHCLGIFRISTPLSPQGRR